MSDDLEVMVNIRKC